MGADAPGSEHSLAELTLQGAYWNRQCLTELRRELCREMARMTFALCSAHIALCSALFHAAVIGESP